jgi:hypothetical protein
MQRFYEGIQTDGSDVKLTLVDTKPAQTSNLP